MEGAVRFACVKVGTKYGPEYVARLRDGIARHCSIPHEFVCYTDDVVEGVDCEPVPALLPGWWAKLGLFKLREPLVYFDLDVVMVGDPAPLASIKEFTSIKDWWMPMLNSSVMVLTGQEGHVFDFFNPHRDISRMWAGDQQWITERVPHARHFPAEWFPSYKANGCQQRFPSGAIAVIFHGNPKPADIDQGWVPAMWRGAVHA